VSGEAEVRIRPLREADIEMIIEIDAEISGEGKPGFWRGLLTVYEPETPEEDRIEGPMRKGAPTPLTCVRWPRRAAR
jgi:hypothetical protein